jgi:hypothetical protein
MLFYGQMRREDVRVAVDAGARSGSAAAVIQIALWTDPKPANTMRSTTNFIERVVFSDLFVQRMKTGELAL